MSEKKEKILIEGVNHRDGEFACPIVVTNPGICPFSGKIMKMDEKLDNAHICRTEIKTDVAWLKKGYWLQIGMLLAVLGFIAKLAGVY